MDENREQPADDVAGWTDVAAAAALDPDFPLAVVVDGEPVGLYLHDGEVRALENVCPHAHAILTDGFQEAGLIECPLHAARFEIATGLCLDEIGQRDLVCHRVRVRDGRVEVALVRSDGS
ncbi:MAG: non-heme iron oxygenase ferredoxin subunit [Lautropia sp.]